MKHALLGLVLVLAARCSAENTPCVASFCLDGINRGPFAARGSRVLPVDDELSQNVSMLESLRGGVGRAHLSRYPILSLSHLTCVAFHDVLAFLMIAIILYQWLVSQRGGATHVWLGRFLVYVAMPLSILPALFIALYLRPQYGEHKDNNFPTPFLVRIIGLYGLSYLACGLGGVVFTWCKSASCARAMALFHLANTCYWLEVTRHIHSELWWGGHAPESKVFKLSAQMSIITTAFVVWEPTNCYILWRFGAFSSSGLAPDFNARRHHVLNMTYLTVLALFAPALFFFHDTHYVWTPAHGFSAAGLSWMHRTAGMVASTLAPVFLPKLPLFIAHVRAAASYGKAKAS